MAQWTATWLSLKVLVEKTGATFVQTFIGLWLAAGSLDASTAQEFAIAGVGAGLTVVMNSKVVMPVGLTYWEDLVWRVGRTWIAAFGAVYLSMAHFSLDREYWDAALAAGVAAVLALVKSEIARRVSNPKDGNLVETRVGPPPAA